MIRFIDMGRQVYGCDADEYQGNEDLELPRSFAFWDTITGRFLEFDGEQSWDSWEDFESALEGEFGAASRETPSGNGRPWHQRCRAVCPECVFGPPPATQPTSQGESG